MAAVRRAAAPVAVLAAVCAAFGYVGAVDPNEPGHYPVCPLLHHTGILCPGCGGLRSAHALAHGDLVTAAGANVLVVAAVLALGCLWAAWTARCLRPRQGAPGPEPGQQGTPGRGPGQQGTPGRGPGQQGAPGRKPVVGGRKVPVREPAGGGWKIPGRAEARNRWYCPAWAAAGLLVVAFTVVRNLPAGGWLAP